MNTEEQQCLIISSRNCIPSRPEQLRSVFSCHSLGFLLSLLWRTTRSCFCLGITFGVSESRFLKIYTSILSHYSSCSNCTLSCESLCLLSYEFWVWRYSWAACISLSLRERFLSLLRSILALALFFGWTHHARVCIHPYHLHVWTTDRIKNGGPYQCF